MTETLDEPGDVALRPGTVLEGKYRIERPLGAGGMGVVYEATHLHLQKRVAIKMLAPSLAQRDDLAQRVVREARAASATGHPNIALVTDLGWHDEVPFFVMELVQGTTLADLLARGPLPIPRAASIACQVLDGLQAVHDVGITHRDLKPSNVMVAQDRRRGSVVKLLDFGISKLREKSGDDEQDLTRPGAVMGTPRHMAPEQVLGEADVDHRADIHAAGSLLYTMLVGRSPFAGSNATATMARVIEGRYEAATTIVPGLPRELDAIIAKAMAVDRAERYPSADAMRKALLPFANAKRAVTMEAEDAGPPRVGEADDPQLDPSNLPPLVSVGGTEVDQGAWPAADGRRGSALPGTILPVGDPGLELDVPDGWHAGDGAKAEPDRRARGGRSFPWAVVVVLALAAGGAWFAWTYRSDLQAGAGELGKRVEGGGAPGEVVLLMVDTIPKDAIVYVDDVQHAERPISIPKTGKYVKLRVVAEGYQERTIQVEAKASRRLQVTLDRKRK